MAAHAGKKFWQCRLRDYVPLKIWGLRRLSPQPVGMMDFGAASLSAFQPFSQQGINAHIDSYILLKGHAMTLRQDGLLWFSTRPLLGHVPGI